MFRYADPEACPACRHQIDHTRTACSACGVALLGLPAERVFAALTQVDRLVAELAPPVVESAEPDVEPASVHEVAASAAGSRTSLSAASVPKILLGLGALCLLVASIVFLVVAWATLGVGGRTAVLVGFTAVATLLMALVARRGLRAGAEAFSVVALGLLSIDLGGARAAGWLGSMGDSLLLVVAGTVIALAGVATACWARTTRVDRLLGAEVSSVVAVGVVAISTGDAFGLDATGPALAATLVCVAAAAAARVIGLQALTLGSRVEAVLAWLALVVVAVDGLEPASVQHVWIDLAVWPTLVTAALAGLVATQTYLPLWSRVTAAAAAAVVGGTAVTVVSFDESATTLALVQLGVVAACGVVVRLLRTPVWGWAAAVPSAIAALALAGSVLTMTLTSIATVVPPEVWGTGLTAGLPGPDIPWTWPLLLPVGVIGICASVATALACASKDPRVVVLPGAALATVAVVLVPPLYGAPLVIGVLTLVLGAVLLAAAGFLTDRVAFSATAAGVVAVALVAGLANEWTTALVLATVVAGAAVAERRPGVLVSAFGLVLTPVAAAALIWTLGHLAGMPAPWLPVPVIAILGLHVVLRPGAEREAVHGLAAAAAIAGSAVADVTPDPTWLAVHLTLAGVAATTSALVNPSRRSLAWVGLSLFAAAQWVRLSDLGVDTVEAYTLPLALVLLVVGCVSLVRGDQTSVRTLGPGLGLALVPSLLLVLEDPVGLRAVLLGLACLALVAIGLTRHLAAPLAAGAVVGALVVLRQGTLAEVLPQWAIIGLVGVGLTLVGITWEQRLHELRRASAYVRGLR